MITVLVLAALAFCGLMVLGVLAAVAGVVGFAFTLPFRIFGLLLKLLGFLIALPFLLIGGVIALFFGLLPFAPLAALAWFVWWLFHDRSRPQRSQASVV